MAFKFVHAADLHLDSPFLGLGAVDNEIARLLRDATFQAFHNVIDLCIEEEVDFLLLAGDIYDAADRSLRAQLVFRDGLQRLDQAGIRSFVVHGNHDPLDGWSSSIAWPELSHFFRGKGVEAIPVERNGETKAIVHGISFPRRDVRTNLVPQFKNADVSAFNIGLLHCNVGLNTGHEPYAPCTVDDLRRTGMDYWALGHIHARTTLSENSPLIAYAGNIQGRHINELGPRGCYLVAVNDSRDVSQRFVATDAFRWLREEVKIDGLGTEEDLLTALEAALGRVQESAAGRPVLCRLVLSGRGPLHKVLRRVGTTDDILARMRDIGKQLDPPVWLDALEIETKTPIDIELRREAPDILGDCLRLVEEYRQDPLLRAELSGVVEELYDAAQFRKVLAMPNDDELLAILAEAEALCLDKFQGENDE